VSLAPEKTYSLSFTTNCGTFVVTLDQQESPKTAASLVALARAGFYDGTVFHRIVPGFVIQGGDPTQTGTGGPGYQTVDTPPADAAYLKGVVAMAKTAAEAPGTSGSQFFVVTADDAPLPPEYAIVGRVTSGLAVVERIGLLGDADEQPTEPVVVEKVTVTEG
jgi:cyclophilin family peptidyl-prolyl cis-trans isomerase